MIQIKLVCEKCMKEKSITLNSEQYYLEGRDFYKIIKGNDFRISHPPSSVDTNEHLKLLICRDCAKEHNRLVRSWKKDFDRKNLEYFGEI